VPFHSLAGSAVEVPMMQREGSMRLREQGNFVAVELLYANDRFRLVLITSKVKPARVVEFRPVADWLGGEGFAQGVGEQRAGAVDRLRKQSEGRRTLSGRGYPDGC